MSTENAKPPKALKEKPITTEFAARPAEPGRPGGLKIRRIGNSLGVVLPKEVVAAMRAKEGDMLVPDVGQNGVLTLKLGDPEVDRLLQLADGIMERRRKVLRALAK